MRLRLKGLNRVRKTLASGKVATYYYAWKGGPRIEGKFGSPEFIASYNRAVAQKQTPASNVLSSVLWSYEDSSAFNDLAERTKRDYRRHIRQIEADFGTFPLSALRDPRTRGEFLSWRERLAASSPRQADYAYSVLALIIAWAYNRGIVDHNPCERPGRLYRGSRTHNIWRDEDKRSFMAVASPNLALALDLALWTGQRQGDLLRLKWSDYDGEFIELTQGKTRESMRIPVAKPLRIQLDAAKRTLLSDSGGKDRHARTILVTSRGKAWTSAGFRSSWRKVCIAAGIENLTFHDLRGTAVTRLAIAGCTVPEIATITGHSLRDVGSILDRHYLRRDTELAKSAIGKLEKYSTD